MIGRLRNIIDWLFPSPRGRGARGEGMRGMFRNIFLFLMMISVVNAADVSIFMRPEASGTWERNGIYTQEIVMRNNTTADIKVAGVELSFGYVSSNFKEIPDIQYDNFIIPVGDYVANTLESTINEVLCQKGIKKAADPNYISLPAGSDYTVYRLEYRVAGDTDLGQKDFIFKYGTTIVKRLADDNTETIDIDITNGTVNIVEDITPPITEATPLIGILNIASYSDGITLAETVDNRYDDLANVHYTVDNSDPTLASPATIGSISGIPNNDWSTRSGINFTLKYFGVDNDGNTENIKSKSFIVDTVAPVILSLNVNRTYAKENDQIIITFKVSETVVGYPTVTLGSYSAALVNYDAGLKEYTYRYTPNGTESESLKTITVTVTDLNGNAVVDNSLSVTLDFTKPVYSLVSISDPSPQAGDVVTIVIGSSEDLNTSQTLISIDGNFAIYQSDNGSEFTYEYSVVGDEQSNLIYVEGVDLAGNRATNIDGWGNINATAEDIYGNPGSGSGQVTINYISRDKAEGNE